MDSQDTEYHWIESSDEDDTVENGIEYVEFGRFSEDERMVLNILIKDPEIGERR